MAIYMTARFRVQPEALEKCKQAIEDFVTYVRENEPRTWFYVSLHETADATSFLHYFIFEDEVARELHSSSDATRRFTEILYPEVIGEVQFTSYKLLSTT